jgi:hypothetical protein
MIGQDAVGQDSDRVSLQRVDHDALERLEVGVLSKEVHLPDGPIQYVINQSAWGNACCARHDSKR